MIIRIVRMHFLAGKETEFLAIFNLHMKDIRHVAGCSHLELLKDADVAGSYTTLSYWQDRSYLALYRNSPLFKEVWAQVKPLFSKPAEACSLEKFLEVD